MEKGLFMRKNIMCIQEEKSTYVPQFKNLNATARAARSAMAAIFIFLVEWYDTQDGVNL